MITVKIIGLDELKKDLDNLQRNIPRAAGRVKNKFANIVKRNLTMEARRGAWPVSASQTKRGRLSKSFHIQTIDNQETHIISGHPAATIVDTGGPTKVTTFWVHDRNAKQVYIHDKTGRRKPLIKKGFGYSIKGKGYLDKAEKASLPKLDQLLETEFNIKKLMGGQ